MSDQPDVIAEISPEEARDLVAAGAFLLDVREDEEWVAGHAGDAVHVPMGAVVDRVAEIPSDGTVVCVCRAGGRSAAVATTLAGLGFDVRNLQGGMQAWEATGFPVVTDAGDPGRVA